MLVHKETKSLFTDAAENLLENHPYSLYSQEKELLEGIVNGDDECWEKIDAAMIQVDASVRVDLSYMDEDVLDREHILGEYNLLLEIAERSLYSFIKWSPSIAIEPQDYRDNMILVYGEGWMDEWSHKETALYKKFAERNRK